LRRYLLTDGQRNEFNDGVVPPRYKTVFMAKWLGVAPWELEAHPDWYEDVDVCSAANIQAERGLKVTTR
jgi:hypothetical protein